MTDGFGRRVETTDSATGEAIEHLDLSVDLVLHTAFASALADRVTRLATVRHASYVRLVRVDRPAPDRLVVVSEATPGRRLSDLLDQAARTGRRPAMEAVVALLRQLLPAVALFSRHRKDHALGTLAAERLWMVAPARVVIADAALGAAVDHLALSRSEAWRRYRIAAAPSDDAVVSQAKGDVTALGVIALALLLGRPIRDEEFPDALAALVDQARERHGEEDHPLSSVFARWLRRALQLETSAFDSPQAAQVAFEEVLASNRRYVTGTTALEEWIEQLGGFPGQAPAATGPVPVVEHTPSAADPAPAAIDADVSAVEEPSSGRFLGLRPQWALALLVVVLLQAGVIGWYWTRPAPGPAPGEGELVVTSRPTGARVVIDGSERGQTPLTVTLPAGAHVIEVQAGTGEPRVIPLVIRANVQTAQYVELQENVPVAPAVEQRTPARPKR
jgi:hypothetical protein